MTPLDPDLLVRAYSVGVFPMADAQDAPDVFWVEPKRRGILPLGQFHLPRSLAKVLRSERFELTVDRAFDRVMRACAEATPDRPSTWINSLIVDAYQQLFERGQAHSVECWRDGELAGGLYGVHLGAAFFGESMFTRERDASKVALAHLVARLRAGGFTLLDTQFLTDHLARFGTVEVGRDDYKLLLSNSIRGVGDWGALDAGGGAAASSGGAADDARAALPDPTTTVSGPVCGKRIAQLLTQTS
jgi:leucyl/phenylalanyl-tRNA--protein transferase